MLRRFGRLVPGPSFNSFKLHTAFDSYEQPAGVSNGAPAFALRQCHRLPVPTGRSAGVLGLLSSWPDVSQRAS